MEEDENRRTSSITFMNEYFESAQFKGFFEDWDTKVMYTPGKLYSHNKE